MSQKARLGRGLDALLGGDSETTTVTAGATIAVDRIQQNPFQPRKNFDEEELARLSESIKVHGVLQPLVVRQVGETFQLIAGERRLRAAQLAGVGEVPVHLVDFNDQEIIEAALAENIQRSDLNPIEKAQGFADYLSRFNLTEQALADRLGLGRSSIANLVGLLNLPVEVQDKVRSGQVSLGHAKVLKGLTDADRQISLAKDVILKQLTVRELEELVKQVKADPSAQSEGKEPAAKDVNAEKTAHVESIENELRQKLLVRGVAIKLKTKDKGQIVLSFDSNDDFERIVEVLRR